MNIGAWIDRRKTWIINLSIDDHGLAVTRHPAGNTPLHRHTLPDVLSVSTTGNGDIKLLAVTGREHDGHLIGVALLKGGISDFIENGVQIGRKSDHLPQFVNGYCFPQLYIFHPQTAYFHGAGE